MSIKSWFKGVKSRLLLAGVLPVVGFVILGSVAMSGVSRLVTLLNIANEQVIPTFEVVGDMRTAGNAFGYQMWSALVVADNKQLSEPRIKAAQEAIARFKKDQEIYDPIVRTEEEDKLYQEVKPLFPKFYAAAEDAIKFVKIGNPESVMEAQIVMDSNFAPLFAQISKWTEGTQKIYGEMAHRGQDEAKEDNKFVSMVVISVTAVGSIIIFGLMIWLAANIANSVSSVATRLTDAGSQVSLAIRQLNEAGNSLSQTSTEAAASLEETVASLEELTSMVQMNSDNAKQAAALSSSAKDSAEKGQAEINNLIQAMSNISNSSKKIEEIISVIDDIAFQTNLLALNAAVEAARAGEQGKGFAVVAEAVRALAQRSSSSAKDISTLIKDSVAEIENGAKIADQSGVVLNNIVTSIKKVADLNNEIAAASSEQTAGIQQISKAMNQLDQSAQSNAASAEEIAATSGEINSLAETNRSLTVELNKVVIGEVEQGENNAIT